MVSWGGRKGVGTWDQRVGREDVKIECNFFYIICIFGTGQARDYRVPSRPEAIFVWSRKLSGQKLPVPKGHGTTGMGQDGKFFNSPTHRGRDLKHPQTQQGLILT